MRCDTSYQQIAIKITVYEDLDTVCIGDEKYSQCLTQPVGNLAQWLYCNLHIGHPSFFDDFDINSGDLYDRIRKAIPDISMPQEAHRLPSAGMATIDEVVVKTDVINGTVDIPCLRPRLSPGFCMFVHTDKQREKMRPCLWRYYLSENDADCALDDWQSIVIGLVDAGFSFSTKMLSNVHSYPRNDAIVVYCAADAEAIEKWLIQFVEKREHLLNASSCSALCHRLIGCLAEGQEPSKDSGIRQSFGEHRCTAIAYAIQDHMETGLPLSALLKQRFLESHIDPDDVSRNFETGETK